MLDESRAVNSIKEEGLVGFKSMRSHSVREDPSPYIKTSSPFSTFQQGSHPDPETIHMIWMLSLIRRQSLIWKHSQKPFKKYRAMDRFSCLLDFFFPPDSIVKNRQVLESDGTYLVIGR
uniref:Uncharacterized protein n=1 Tax=Utricularia reniformis TaxID=192314 RepID=A0A1Y0B3U1_9LAMI|nr:hypothetical protein AEK19_MT1902 [Utricularia reniformis]ART32070.1 hypothetical protein AEK19_MT1902 [Utricularia reniformis]